MDNDGNGNPQQKDGFELDEQQAEKFNKLEVEMKKKDAEMMALKQENDKLKGENEALKTGTSPVCLESSTESAIASDFTPEMNTQKRPAKRFIINMNCLDDSIKWIGRNELANSSLSTSCELFRQLCWPKLHQNVKPYKIPYLDFIKAQHFANQVQLRRNLKEGEEPDYYADEFMVIPIASIPPPDYIVGFKNLNFWFVNDQVVNFAENIAHLLQNCKLVLCLDTPFITWKKDKKRVTSTCTLLKCLADKIFKIEFRNEVRNADNEATLGDFNELFPGILDHVQSNEGRQVQDYTRIIIELD